MKRKHHEQKFCTQLGKWWDYVGKDLFPNKVLVGEAKISVGTTPFNYKSGFKIHQVPTLHKYKTKATHWKISDADTESTKHFDILMTNPGVTIACIPILWIRRGNNTFYLIDPDIIQDQIDDGHKSLKEKEAKVLCFYKGEVR